jgi:hypothetical protein
LPLLVFKSRFADLDQLSSRGMNRFFLLLLIIFWQQLATGQVNVRDSAASAWMVGAHFSGFVLAGDLADRYGAVYGPSLSVGKKTRSNWLFGAEGTFFFGGQVNNVVDIFGDLVTEQGFFVGLNGEYAAIDFQHRGWYGGAYFGKILPVLNPNPNSGLFFKIGVGYLQHKIFIQDSQGAFPQLSGSYGAGYDRLHTGFSLRQEFGYLNSGANRTVNFMISFDFIQGFMSSARQFNWDEQAFDLANKLDLYFGLRLTWFLPIYDKNQQKFYYY